MISKSSSTFSLTQKDAHWIITFIAMASPCEILLSSPEASEAQKAASLAFTETIRIERKYSRYRAENIIHQINHSEGEPVAVGDETFRLLTYAGQCYELSQGKFDVTSGVLRRAWEFKGKEVVPDENLIEDLLNLVGWDKVVLENKTIRLRPGMEIDLGGVGKEYAVDRVADLLHSITNQPLLVNFGGDIRAIGKNPKSGPWRIGIEKPTESGSALGMVELVNGAVATSGNAQRYCFVKGKRRGHILDPTTGWPVRNAPLSVTVIAANCLEAGLLSTLAMLQGEKAESFLEEVGFRHYVAR